MIEPIEVVARETEGRGVSVLHDFRDLPVYTLQESPTNPRRSFDETKLHELAQSIRSQGVLVPLIVRELDLDRFEIVAGARRFRAARLAQISTVPVRIVRLSDTQVLEYQLIENAIREDVHPYEEAMAYKALLETSEPRYDVASIAAKTGRSMTHIYQRLRLAELIADAAIAFQANQITAGHAVLIARLPQDQQKDALTASFREDYRTKEKHAVSARELAQWIREHLMLTLADAVFDVADAELVSAVGACTACPRRTGANTVLFEDFAEDDRCMDAPCFKAKVEAHIAREKEKAAGLIQITRAYYTNSNGEERVLTRNEYTIVEPEKIGEGSEDAQQQSHCSKATAAIVVEGPGKRGELVQICADPECEVHGKPNFRVEQEAAQRERQEEWKRHEEERQKNRDHNRRLLDAVLNCIPKKLARADYETLVFAIIDRLQYEDWDAVCDYYNIDTDEAREPDAAAFELRKKTRQATEPQLVRMLMELALLPSGYAEEALEPLDPLASTARRYGVSLAAKPKAKAAKCSAKATPPRTHSRPKATSKGNTKATTKVAAKGGAA
ncbi:MAG TPA: ParB/RepB/Spo0J family partition protein [Terriglobales bacterium]|nr:ParB/RepB/Spo0J family partition protein [Terriglobales bacterium]